MRLSKRVRWKRCLRKLQRFVWLVAGLFLFLYFADALLGLDTLSLRIAFPVLLLGAGAIFALDVKASCHALKGKVDFALAVGCFQRPQFIAQVRYVPDRQF